VDGREQDQASLQVENYYHTVRKGRRMSEPKSSITNCIINIRENQKEPMFDEQDSGDFVIRLDRYAIIPVEEYHALTKKKSWLEVLMFWK